MREFIFIIYYILNKYIKIEPFSQLVILVRVRSGIIKIEPDFYKSTCYFVKALHISVLNITWTCSYTKCFDKNKENISVQVLLNLCFKFPPGYRDSTNMFNTPRY